MKSKTYMLNTLLGVVLGVALLATVLVRTFAPAVILPAPDVPNLVPADTNAELIRLLKADTRKVIITKIFGTLNNVCNFFKP